MAGFEVAEGDAEVQHGTERVVDPESGLAGETELLREGLPGARSSSEYCL